MIKKISLYILLSSIFLSPLQLAYAEDEIQPEAEAVTTEAVENVEEVEPTEEPIEEATEEATEEPVEESELLLNSGSAEGESKEVITQRPITNGAVTENDIIIPSFSTNIEDMEEEKKRLEEEQQKNQEAVDTKKEELASLNKELSEALAKINELDAQASDLSVKIYETQQNLDSSNKEKDEQYADMKKRIQYMYENGDISLLEALFTSKDMAEAMNAADYYQRIYDYDRDKLEQFKELVERIASLKEEQEAELAQIEELKNEADVEKAKLEIFIAEKQGDIDALSRSISESEEGIATLDANILEALNRMASEASARAAYQGNSEALLKIAEAAQEQALKEGKANAKTIAVARNAGRGISTFPLTYGWCAAWVSGVYNITGGIVPPHGNAIDYWNKWKASGSTRMDNVPIGACVISSGDPTYGHIGIYLGGGVVASNLGYCKVETIESFGASATAVCQGHRGYIGWVWPNGQSLL